MNNKLKKQIEAGDVIAENVNLLDNDRGYNRMIMNSAYKSIFRAEYRPLMMPFRGGGDSGKLPKGDLRHPPGAWNPRLGPMNRKTRRRLARDVTRERFRDYFRAPVNK